MVLLYRCWLVWGKNYYIIILPFLTALAGFGAPYHIMLFGDSVTEVIIYQRA